MASILIYIGNLLWQTLNTIVNTVLHNWPILAFGILTAAAVKTYINTERWSAFLLRRSKVSIVASVIVGAFTPFCACGTTAVIVGMLTTTLPWGPIMAFLTSSPLMSPNGFVMISGFLGLRFALALTLASLVIGLGSGYSTLWLETRTDWLKNQSRFRSAPAGKSCSCSASGQGAQETAPAGALAQTVLQDAQAPSSGCGCQGCATLETSAGEACACADLPAVSFTERLRAFARQCRLREFGSNLVNIGLKQILLYFSIFVGIGYLINTLVPMSIISALFGAGNAAAVPLAALIGLPLYLTTESGIPIIQQLLASGADEGAMLAFIITGSATSAWVIAGITSFMKKRMVGLYVGFILVGGILCGYLYDLVRLVFHG